jgi:hypothetical protein
VGRFQGYERLSLSKIPPEAWVGPSLLSRIGQDAVARCRRRLPKSPGRPDCSFRGKHDDFHGTYSRCPPAFATNRGTETGVSPWLLAPARFQPGFRRIRPGAADQTYLRGRMGCDVSTPGAPGDYSGGTRGAVGADTGCRSAGQQLIKASETKQDALLDLAIDPLVIHDEQISSGTVGLRADEQAGAPVSPSWVTRSRIASTALSYLQIRSDTRISR